MSTPPDILVYDELKAQYAALAVDDAPHRALFNAMFHDVDSDLRDRIWTSYISAQPEVFPGYHRGDKIPFPSVMVVCQEERPENKRLSNRIGPRNTVTIGAPPDDGEFFALGGTWRQSVLLLLLDKNPERIRYLYFLTQKLMYRVAHEIMGAEAVGGASPASAGELTPVDEFLPSEIFRRSIVWDFLYEQVSFTPTEATATDATVRITSVFSP